MRFVLQMFGLGSYAEDFIEQGFDDADWVFSMDDDLVRQMLGHVGMKDGHSMKFQHAYYTEKSRHEPSGPRGQIWVYGMQPPAWRAWDGALHMHQMHTLLKAMGLVAYKDRFEEMGYDDVRFLRYMSEEQVEYMLAGVGMKISHAIRFRAKLKAGILGE